MITFFTEIRNTNVKLKKKIPRYEGKEFGNEVNVTKRADARLNNYCVVIVRCCW